MLSYRHGFHAGNFADVHKHIILVAILSYLKQKAKPFSYIDTHAGAGLYPLDLEFMQKNKEYESGIAKLWQHENSDVLTKQYLNVIQQFNSGKKLTCYPGSPLIAARLLNADDKLHAFELHNTDYPLLKQALQHDKRAKVHHLNAYEALLGFVPPPAKRGLIMLDPSFEVKTEYVEIVKLIQQAHKKFSTGIYALWYPIVDRKNVQRLIHNMKQTKIENVLCSEWCIAPDSEEYGMTGSGMIVINPPYTLKAELQKTQQQLKSVLGLHSTELKSI